MACVVFFEDTERPDMLTRHVMGVRTQGGVFIKPFQG